VQKYYKKSLYFLDNFIEIDYLYRTKFIFSLVEKYINDFMTNKYAQTLLMNHNINKNDTNKKIPEIKLVPKTEVNEEKSNTGL